MDGQQFDSVARSLGAASTRRAAVAGLLAAVLPFTAEARRRKQGGRDRRFSADGPCGDGGPKPNRCQRDRDCCTGICDKRAGRRLGRCRCQQAGQRCDASRNCCQRGRAQRCQEGRCRPVPTALTCDPTCDQEQRQYCNPDTGSCCGAIDASCTVPSDCCVNNNNSEFACVQGECNFCATEGPCSFDGTCCSEDCRDGQCYCEPLGATCSDRRQCCDFITNTVACESGSCCISSTVRQCGDNTDCCSGVCCDGFCCAEGDTCESGLFCSSSQ